MNQASDRTKLRRLQNRILARKGLVCCGPEFTLAIHSRGKAVFVGANRYGQGDVTAYEDVAALACSARFVVALMKDGTLRLPSSRLGYAMDVKPEGLAHVRAVSCSDTHIAALLGNGRVVAGRYGLSCKAGVADTSEWPAVLDVVCGRHFIAGLTPEGRVLVAGGGPRLRYTVSRWSGVAGLFADGEGEHLYAVTVDGYLLSTASLPRMARAWRNLVFVAASGRRIMGVTATGQLCATCTSPAHPEDKTGYVACALSATHAVALSRDGRVRSVGSNEFGQCDTRKFGVLFENFDEFLTDRRALMLRVIAEEKTYQIRLVEAARYGSRMLCGHRITACITADGRVLTSAGFGKAKHWTSVRALACGNAHLVARHEGGWVSADGNDTEGCTHVENWSGIKSVAAGKYHTLGVTEDGRVLFCGRNDHGQGDVTDWTGVRRVYAADRYTVGLGYDGALRVAGQPPFDPAAVAAWQSHPADVVVTATHMAALYPNGQVLSTVTIPASDRPCDGEVWDTNHWQGIRAIAAGHGFTVGLGYDGRVVVSHQAPAAISHAVLAWRGVVALSCGWDFVLGLTADGRVLSAGKLRVERKGTEATYAPHTSMLHTYEAPNTASWRDALALSAGPHHALAMTRGGTILATGLDSDGQCACTTHFTLFRDSRQLYGYGKYRKVADCGITPPHVPREPAESVSEASALTPFPHGTVCKPAVADRRILGSFALGMVHALALGAGGKMLHVGADDSGQLSIASYGCAVQVAAGPYHSAAILADGSLVASGRNPDGRCDYRLLNRELDTVGVSNEESRHGTVLTPNDPDPALLPYAWLQVACGHAHTVALRSDGRVYAVGANPDGRCDTRKWRDVFFVSCGVRHTVAIRADGTCVATGDNRYGQCDVSLWKNVVMVAAGEYHTVGLCADGRVVTAGNNRKGQGRVEDLRDVISVACLPEATLCVCADGCVVIRGGDGELDRAVESLREVVALHTCEHRVAALTVDRRVILLPNP